MMEVMENRGWSPIQNMKVYDSLSSILTEQGRHLRGVNYFFLKITAASAPCLRFITGLLLIEMFAPADAAADFQKYCIQAARANFALYLPTLP